MGAGHCDRCGTLYREDENGILRAWGMNGKIVRVLTTRQWEQTGILTDIPTEHIDALVSLLRRVEMAQERDSKDWHICAVRYVYEHIIEDHHDELLPKLDVIQLIERLKAALQNENVASIATAGETLRDVEATLLSRVCDRYLEELGQSIW